MLITTQHKKDDYTDDQSITYIDKNFKKNHAPLVPLLGEVVVTAVKQCCGYGIFKGLIIQVFIPRDNNKIYCIKYEDVDEEDIIFTKVEYINHYTTVEIYMLFFSVSSDVYILCSHAQLKEKMYQQCKI